MARLVSIHPWVPSCCQFRSNIVNKKTAHHTLFMIRLILVEHILLALHYTGNWVTSIKVNIPVPALGMQHRKRESYYFTRTQKSISFAFIFSLSVLLANDIKHLLNLKSPVSKTENRIRMLKPTSYPIIVAAAGLEHATSRL